MVLIPYSMLTKNGLVFWTHKICCYLLQFTFFLSFFVSLIDCACYFILNWERRWRGLSLSFSAWDQSSPFMLRYNYVIFEEFVKDNESYYQFVQRNSGWEWEKGHDQIINCYGFLYQRMNRVNKLRCMKTSVLLVCPRKLLEKGRFIVVYPQQGFFLFLNPPVSIIQKFISCCLFR